MRLNRRAKRRLIVLFAVLVVMIGGLFGFRYVRTYQQERLVVQARIAGLAASETGDLDLALEKLQYVLQHEPDDLEALLAIADARMRTPMRDGRHLAEAMGYYRHTLDAIDRNPDVGRDDPRYRQTLRSLLDLYMTLGLRFELVGVAEQILEFDPENVDALTAKARASFTDRDFDDAMGYVDRLIEVEPDRLDWRRFKLELLNQQGHTEKELLSLCDEWQAGHDADGRYLLLKTQVLAQAGEDDAARKTARAAIEMGADSLEVLQEMIGVLDAIGERELASEVVIRAKAEFPDEHWVQEAAIRRLWQTGRYDAALRELATIKSEDDVLSPALVRLEAMLLIAQNRLDDARAVLYGMTSSDGANPVGEPQEAWARALLARLDHEVTGWRNVVQTVQQAVLLQPQDAVLHFVLGETYAQIGESTRALQAYRQAAALDPNWLAAGIAYAELLLAQGRVEEAYPVARMLMDRATEGQPTVYLIFARTYLALRKAGGDVVISNASTGERIRITNLLEAVYELMPDSPDVATLLVEAYVDEGRLDTARNFITAQAGDERTTTNVLVGLIDVSRRHDLGLEATLVETIRGRGSDDFEVALAEATLLSEQGDDEAGLALLDDVIAAGPADRIEPMQRERVTYMISAGHRDAASALRRLVDDYPSSPRTLAFALAQDVFWNDRDQVRTTIDRLKELIGETAQQVRLAEANYLIRFRADDEVQLANAIVLVNGVLEQTPESLPGLVLMARASLLGEHPSPERAIEHLERAVNLYPYVTVLYGRLVQLLQESGEFDRAEQYLHRLSRLTEHQPDLQRTELRLLRAQGDFEAAMVRASEIVDRASSDEDKLLLAAMQQQAGQIEAAEATYESLLESDAPSEFVLAQVADFFANTGRFERGLEVLERSSPQGGPAVKAMLQGMYHQRHGNLDVAGELIRKAVDLEPDLAVARHHLARYYLAISDRDAARREALKGLQIDPEHLGLKATLALAKIGLGPEARREAIQSLDALGSDQAPLVASLRLLQTVPVNADGTMAPTAEHAAAAQQLVAEHGHFVPAWLLAISIHVELDRIDAAIDLARRAVSRLPAYPEPTEWATRLLTDAGRWEEALIEAHEWRRRAMSNPMPVDLVIASILLELQRPGDAVQQLSQHEKRLVAERARYPDRVALWVTALLQANRSRGAIPIVETLVAEDAAWRRRFLLSIPQLSDRVAEQLLEVLEAPSDDPAAQLDLAVAWSRLGRRTGDAGQLERAETLSTEAGRHESLHGSALLVRGTIEEARGDLESAERWYREALENDPRSALALNNLAYVVAQSPSRSGEALGYAEQAIELLPEHPDLLDTYAFILLSLERTDEAERVLDRALTKRPGDIGIRLRLIEVLMASDRNAEAQSALRDVELDILDRPNVEADYRDRLESARQRLRQTQATAE